MWVRPNLVISITLLTLLGLACGACNGNHAQNVSTRVNGDDSSTGQAHWMLTPPTTQSGAYSFYLLDPEQNPVRDASWLTVSLNSTADGDDISVSSITPPPDDIYLYITYPGDNRRLANIQLADSLDADYLLCSIAQRIENTVVVGLSRYGSARETAAVAGNLCTLDFVLGREQTYKTSSLVNDDGNSAPLLEISGSQPGGSIDLTWDERNIGDYNNNGEIEIADITPIALNYGKTLEGSLNPAELLLVDGDVNGEINLADITPIARNYARTVDGYTVFHAAGVAPAAGDFLPLEIPTVTRQQTWDSLSDTQRRKRLQYSYHHEVGLGTHNYYVRAYAADGSPDTQGLQSNTVSQTIIVENLPPQWDSVEGISAAIGTTGGIRVTFGSATDPEGGAVDYVLRYTRGITPMFTPGTVELTFPPEITAGDAPYTYTVEPLTNGQRYNFLLSAYDQEGNGTANLATTSTTVPILGVSTDPWAYLRGDIAGTASKPAFMQPDTLELDWQYDLGLDNGSPDNQPVISKDGWIAVAHSDGTIRRVSMDDGSLLSIHPAATGMGAFLPSLDGNTLVVGTATGLAVYDMATTDPPTAIDLGHEIIAAPLLMGDYVFAVASDGWVYSVVVESGEVAWELDPGDASGFSLSPISDGISLLAVRDDGMVFKVNLLTGDILDSEQLSRTPIGNSLALDAARGFIYVGTMDHRLIELSIDMLEVTRSWARGSEAGAFTEPCLILQADPPFAVMGYYPSGMLERPGHIVAYNLESGNQAWDISLPSDMTFVNHLSAGADRIFTHIRGAVYVFDFDGVRRQSADIPIGDKFASVAIGSEKLALVSEAGGVVVLARDESDLAPEWQMHEGIQSLEVGDASILAHWTHAIDDHGAPAYYTLFVSDAGPPEFDAPYTHTTLIKDIPDAVQFSGGTSDNEYLLDGLENGTRYWVGVRAHDAPWDENPNFDQNTNWLAATPPWQREELLTGVDLPDGGIFTMRGMLGGDGLLHLVYTDVVDGHLAHAWGDTGSWLHESANIGTHYAAAIDLDWGADMLIGVADIPTSKIGIVSREGLDDWTKQLISPSITFPNPQVSFQFGTENSFAYTEHFDGVFPPDLEGHYFISTTVGGTWQDPVPFDEANYSGRDLDLVLDPADNVTPWIAYQRGYGYAPDFFTCETGQLGYAKGDGEGGYELELVDAGENSPDSDCGKRVRQVVESDGTVHIAYLDLNASPDLPTGQLKYAFNDGSGWEIETVHSFSLNFQTMGLQHTWGDISLALTVSGTPMIGFLGRISASRNEDFPHEENAFLWVREGDNQWRGELLTDEERTYPRDGEPCVLLVDGDERIHLFFVTTNLNPALVPDTLVHLWRPGF